MTRSLGFPVEPPVWIRMRIVLLLNLDLRGIFPFDNHQIVILRTPFIPDIADLHFAWGPFLAVQNSLIEVTVSFGWSGTANNQTLHNTTE